MAPRPGLTTRRSAGSGTPAAAAASRAPRTPARGGRNNSGRGQAARGRSGTGTQPTARAPASSGGDSGAGGDQQRSASPDPTARLDFPESPDRPTLSGEDAARAEAELQGVLAATGGDAVKLKLPLQEAGIAEVATLLEVCGGAFGRSDRYAEDWRQAVEDVAARLKAAPSYADETGGMGDSALRHAVSRIALQARTSEPELRKERHRRATATTAVAPGGSPAAAAATTPKEKPTDLEVMSKVEAVVTAQRGGRVHADDRPHPSDVAHAHETLTAASPHVPRLAEMFLPADPRAVMPRNSSRGSTHGREFSRDRGVSRDNVRRPLPRPRHARARTHAPPRRR